jgi:quinoprotein glucose dehydrogenase
LSRKALVLLLGCSLLLLGIWHLSSPSPLASSSTDWRYHGGDAASTRFSPLDQIDGANVGQVRILWRWRAPDWEIVRSGQRVLYGENQATPLCVDGVLYVSTPLNQVAALEASTGETLWTFDSQAWKNPAWASGRHRGVAYWTDGQVERLFLGTQDAYLIALDARTGKPAAEFGQGGRVDLGKGLRRGIDRREYAVMSPPIVCRDVVVVGSSILDSHFSSREPKRVVSPGDVRGYDARTGEQRWRFQSIPQEGEPGNETWGGDSWRDYGATNVWTTMSADEELGYVYLPFSSPNNDFYGGARPGDNLFAGSLVCLDVESGARVWHYQILHHELWDYDLSAAPILVDITVADQAVKAVVQVTKQGFCFAFDRVNGEPVWPIEERAVPSSTVPGERAAPTQPFPSRPPPFERQGLTEDDLIDFTPELRQRALEIIAPYRASPLYAPPSLEGALLLPGIGGGANWPGAAVDPQRGVLYVPSFTHPTLVWLQKADSPDAYHAYFGRFTNTLSGPDGLPLTRPPYGRISAIDLTSGAHLWVRPTGRGPVDHPAIRHLALPDLGWDRRVFPLLTQTLLFAAPHPASSLHSAHTYYVDEEAYLWAFDPEDGRQLAAIELPDNARGNPMSCAVDGRQLIIVPIGGNGRPAELVALGLPRSEAEQEADRLLRQDADHPLYYRAVDALDRGDAEELRQLLTAHQQLVEARGYLGESHGYAALRGATLLHHAAGHPIREKLPGNIVEIARLLLDKGAAVDAVTLDSATTLELVASSAQARWEGVQRELIEMLVRAGADVARERGKCMWIALVNGETEAAAALHASGAPVDLRFASGLNRIDLMAPFFAGDGSLREGAGLLYRPDSIRSVDLSAQQILDEALAYACRNNSLEAAEYLLGRGANIDGKPDGFAPLVGQGSTVLHKAVEANDREVLTFLLKRGADPTVRDNRFNATPRGWAEFLGHPELMRLLREFE